MDARFIYITCKDKQEALTIGRELVESRLVACVNVLDPMTSLYWWKGEVVEDQESVLIAKTTGDKVTDLIGKVKQCHSYEVPCVVSLPIEAGNPDYINWIRQSLLG